MREFTLSTDGFTPNFDVLSDRYGMVTSNVFGKVWRYCQMKDSVCYASMGRIAKELNISRQTVITHVRLLCERGYLEDTTPERLNAPHVYRDTGKLRLVGKIEVIDEGVKEVDSKNVAVKEVDSGCQSILHKDTNKETILDSPTDYPSEKSAAAQAPTEPAPASEFLPGDETPPAKEETPSPLVENPRTRRLPARTLHNVGEVERVPLDDDGEEVSRVGRPRKQKVGQHDVKDLWERESDNLIALYPQLNERSTLRQVATAINKRAKWLVFVKWPRVRGVRTSSPKKDMLFAQNLMGRYSVLQTIYCWRWLKRRNQGHDMLAVWANMPTYISRHWDEERPKDPHERVGFDHYDARTQEVYLSDYRERLAEAE